MPGDDRHHLGIDIGGTFTDISYTGTGGNNVQIDKRLTSQNPSETVKEAITQLEAEGRFSLETCDVFSHATTIATNALIERAGAQTGLITTAGFSDVIEMRDESRYDLYDAHISFPEPIPARRFRRGVTERTAEDGSVRTPLDEDELIEAVDELRAMGAETIGICFLHAYLNDETERRAKHVVEAEFPDLEVSISADVAPQLGEFPRMTTTAINSYLKPIVDAYIAELETFIDTHGFDGNFLIMTSGGGVMPSGAARDVPVKLLESGPTAGALISQYLGEQRGDPDLLSFDMGGTTSKGCIIEDHELDRKFLFEAAREHDFKSGSGYPLMIPNVNLIEFSSGGGSIASLDKMQTLDIGPESQGSDPGPACYALGGEKATITDADVVLGYLREGVMDDDSLRIDRDLAREAIAANIADPLGVDVIDAAAGIYRSANENIANAFKEHAAERGVDVRNSKILAFGGAGPMHATSIARSLNVDTVIVPPNAGVLSSFGLLVSPKGVSITEEVREPLAGTETSDLDARYDSMIADARDVLDLPSADRGDVSIIRKADLRYEGQGFNEEVVIPDGVTTSPANLHELFESHYEERYGVTPDKEIILAQLKLELTADSSGADIDLAGEGHADSVSTATITEQQAYFPAVEAYHETTFYDRSLLPMGTSLETPCIIEGRGSTTVVGPTADARIDETANVVIGCE